MNYLTFLSRIQTLLNFVAIECKKFAATTAVDLKISAIE